MIEKKSPEQIALSVAEYELRQANTRAEINYAESLKIASEIHTCTEKVKAMREKAGVKHE